MLPNQVTIARAIAGVGGASGYAFDLDDGAVWGSALVLLSILLDRLDGELARSASLVSTLGHKLDLYSDALVNTVVFVGLGIALRHSVLGVWGPLLGLAAGLGVVAALAIVIRLEQRYGARSGELESPGLIDPDDAMVMVPLAVLGGGQLPLLITAAIAAPLCALALGWHFRARLRGTRAAPREPRVPGERDIGGYEAAD